MKIVASFDIFAVVSVYAIRILALRRCNYVIE